MKRVRIEDDVVVNASATRAWDAIVDVKAHAEWHPFVERIAGAHQLGATRACDVVVKGKAARTREVCSRLVEGERIAWRVEEDSSGFLAMVEDWESGFILAPEGEDRVRVTAWSEFRPRGLMMRLALPMVRSKFRGAHRAILGGLRGYAENRAGGFSGGTARGR